MAPSPWATPEQQRFLDEEDLKWETIKLDGTTLKSFYLNTTHTFLERWPIIPEKAILEEAGSDVVKARRLAEHQLYERIANWFSNNHHQEKETPAVSKPLLDLSGKHSHKKPPLQKWQAFLSVYCRPRESPLRAEVKSLYTKRHDLGAVGFLTKFLSPDVDIATTDFLTFLGAFSRERCTHLSSEEEKEVVAYIEKQQQLVTEQQDRPWFLDDDYETNPFLAENRFVQQRIDELPRVSQRALEEIEKATGFKAILFIGGLTPTDNGAISTHIHTSGRAVTTGLMFLDSWSGCSEMHKAFGEWLQMAYSKEEKARREGYSTSSLMPASDEEPIMPTELPPAPELTRPSDLSPTMLHELTRTTSDENPVPDVSPAAPQTQQLSTPESTSTETTPAPEIPSPRTIEQ